MTSHACVVSRVKACWMIRRSCGSISPTSCPISVRVRISASVTVGITDPLSGSTARVSFSRGTTSTVRAFERPRKIGAIASEILSALAAAKLLGTISPKNRTRSVIPPVAMPTPADPKVWIAAYVATDAAPMFTTLFPISSVISRRSGLDLSRTRAREPRLPSSASASARVSGSEKRAISAPEKNPDRATRNARTRISSVTS